METEARAQRLVERQAPPPQPWRTGGGRYPVKGVAEAELGTRRRRRRRGSRLRNRRLRLRGRIRIKPEFMVTHPQHVGSREEALAYDSLAVYERAVGTQVRDHIALGCDDDLGVAARNPLLRNDNVTDGFPPQHQRRTLYRVLPSVRQTHQTAPGSRSGFLLRTRSRAQLLQLGNVRGTHELGTPAAPFVDEREFPPSDLDLVTMEQWGRQGPESNSVDEDRRFLAHPPNRRLAVGCHDKDRMSRCQRVPR